MVLFGVSLSPRAKMFLSMVKLLPFWTGQLLTPEKCKFQCFSFTLTFKTSYYSMKAFKKISEVPTLFWSRPRLNFFCWSFLKDISFKRLENRKTPVQHCGVYVSLVQNYSLSKLDSKLGNFYGAPFLDRDAASETSINSINYIIEQQCYLYFIETSFEVSTSVCLLLQPISILSYPQLHQF